MAMLKPSLAVLLGAGASADADIPTTIKMTDVVIDHVAESGGGDVRILDFIRHTLAADLAHQKRDRGTFGRPAERHRPQVDVERLFAAVDLLVDRLNQPWSPFVSAWHPGLESFAPGPSLSEGNLHSELRAFRDSLSGSQTAWFERNTARLLEKAIQLAGPGSVSALLAALRKQMLRSLREILYIGDSSRVAYLTPLTEVAEGNPGGLTVATLNYDRSVENAAERKGAKCHTLIAKWVTSGKITLPRNGLRLVKLHGSIDWITEESRAWSELPMQRIRQVEGEEEKAYYEPAVVFGEAGKLRAEGPYLELLLTWLSELRRANTLLVVGYSFRDAHVNEIIARWFNEAPARRRVVVLSLHEIEQGGDDFKSHLARVDGWESSTDPPPHGFLRFEQVNGRTSDQLPAAIALALEPRIPSA